MEGLTKLKKEKEKEDLNECIQSQTIQLGPWKVDVGLPSDLRKMPRITVHNIRTAMSISYKPDKSAAIDNGLLTLQNADLSDGVQLAFDNCWELLDDRISKYIAWRVANATDLVKSEKANDADAQPADPAKLRASIEQQLREHGVLGANLVENDSAALSDVRKCVLFVGTVLPQMLSSAHRLDCVRNRVTRQALREIVRSDWLRLRNEYDLYRFVRSWANYRVRAEMNAPVDAAKEARKEEIMNNARKVESVQKAKERAAKEKKQKEKEKEKEKEKDDQKEGGEEGKDNDDDKKNDGEGEGAEDSTNDDNTEPKSKPGKNRAAFKNTPEYRERMTKMLEGILEYIRFPMMTSLALQDLHLEPIDIPTRFLSEAYRFHLYGEEPFYRSLPSTHAETLLPRRYIVTRWDPAHKAAQIDISKDGRTITTTQGCSHKTVLGLHGYSAGRNVWTVKLNGQAGCYSAIGIARRDFSLTGGVLGVNEGSYAMRMYSGTHCTTSDRRKDVPDMGMMQAGTLIRLELDMDEGRLDIFVNNSKKVSWKKLTGTWYPALTICHQSGNEGYTLLNN